MSVYANAHMFLCYQLTWNLVDDVANSMVIPVARAIFLASLYRRGNTTLSMAT